MLNKANGPLVLLILDGYGLAPAGPGNATSQANTPNLQHILNLPCCSQLAASGREVGLPHGFIGNSEVGHLNMGAGRIVFQDLTRIDMAIEDNSLDSNLVLLNLFDKTKASGGRLHFLGLLSQAGVHSHTSHLFALLKLTAKHGVQAIVHPFLDGRDSPPTSGAELLAQLLSVCQTTGARVADLCGRFYAMDRDKRWERVRVAWDLLVHGLGKREANPLKALHAAYKAGETDEFITPRLLIDPAEAVIRDADSVFFFNFRADRARQLFAALLQPDFTAFERGRAPQLAALASMTVYDDNFASPVAFAKQNLDQTLGQILSDQGKKQLRLAETEKYAHVTYFFNGGREQPYVGEERILVPSPTEVATYDLKPQMSAAQVCEQLLSALDSGAYDFVVCNLANPDMVGHTGNLEATILALQAVDPLIGQIAAKVLDLNGILLLTSDHGNSEQMLEPDGSPCTAHTTNPTPLAILGVPGLSLRPKGKLGDLAPTILQLLKLPIPPEMTGQSLVEDC